MISPVMGFRRVTAPAAIAVLRLFASHHGHPREELLAGDGPNSRGR